eukprot:5635836-Pleurochrysis_carterae.AAC.6
MHGRLVRERTLHLTTHLEGLDLALIFRCPSFSSNSTFSRLPAAFNFSNFSSLMVSFQCATSSVPPADFPCGPPLPSFPSPSSYTWTHAIEKN